MGDIQTVLETKAIPRLRFGVGHPGRSGQAVVNYVLAPFPVHEEAELEAAIDRAVEAIEQIASSGFTAAMGQFNARS